MTKSTNNIKHGDAATYSHYHFKDLSIFKLIGLMILLNVLLFHLHKVLYGLVFLSSFLFGFFYYSVNNKENKQRFADYLRLSTRHERSVSSGFIKIDPHLLTTSGTASDFSTNNNDTPIKSNSNTNTKQLKPSLTGSYLIDEELHKIIDLFIRDYIEAWYSTEISIRQDFAQLIRSSMYSAIRHVTLCMKTIDWEHFIMNILTHNLVIQMRMLKKTKENRTFCSSPQLNSPKTISSQSSKMQQAQLQATLNEANLVDAFFELEAQIEKVICRDIITYSSAEKEHEFLQELSEILCYSLFSAHAFACLPLRCLIREIMANQLLKSTIENVCDPDYINQTLLYWCQDQAPLTENFLTSINHCESLDELNELALKIDEEILKTRANDTGGQNDQEIKLKLSSLQFIKKRIEACLQSLVNSPQSGKTKNGTPSAAAATATTTAVTSTQDDEYKLFLFNQLLEQLDFSVVLTNETIQHCFIEYMGKHDVQNLISFYLNADMYRQYARKELVRNSSESTLPDKQSLDATKLALKEFAKGLINSYLLNANNFADNKLVTAGGDQQQPVNIIHRAYYKPELSLTVERLEQAHLLHLNEGLLDQLQAKIYLLMKQKYFLDFKSYSELHKILLKNDFIFKYTPSQTSTTANTKAISNPLILTDQQNSKNPIDLDIDDTEAINNESLESDDPDSRSLASLESLESSFELYNNNNNSPGTPLSLVDSTPPSFSISAIITSSGRCNELKTTYAIYIIDVTKSDFGHGDKTKNVETYWQTYRRFNDFYDLHMIIKKKIPTLSAFVLPGKSFRNSLSEEFLERRRIELNRYLQTLCNPTVMAAHPQLLDLMLTFLENKRWENKQTNFKRRVDSFLTPMLSSVASFQTSIKNAPESMFGMVKGISDNLMQPMANSSVTASSVNPASASVLVANNVETTGLMRSSNSSQQQLNLAASAASETTKKSVNHIERTILNGNDLQSNNLPVRVIILLIDEIFDLKEKNLVKSLLMTIVKTFMKNVKGDSMNRKIKEQIADYLSDEYIARYIKNFRKRVWPKGHLAAESSPTLERSKSAKELTKILVKTKLLALVSDELRHILGTDTTRRGIFELFDLFQHRALNKRLFHILTENLLVNLFQMPRLNAANNTMTNSFPTGSIVLTSSQTNLLLQQQLLQNPFKQLVRLHLSKSTKIKSEWKQINKQQHDMKLQPNDFTSNSTASNQHRRSISNSHSAYALNFNSISIPSSGIIANNDIMTKQYPLVKSERVVNDEITNMIRSKSLFSEIQC